MAPPDAQTVSGALDHEPLSFTHDDRGPASSTHARLRWMIAAIFIVTALATTIASANRGSSAKKRPAGPPAREVLAAQLAGEAESIDRALAAVTTKLADVDALHTRRAVAAFRLIRDARESIGDPITVARRRAAARLLLEHDVEERTLLADEKRRLEAARERVAGERTKLASVALPGKLLKPARGSIIRAFGTLVHERSKATLARRGIDFDVEARADAIAPADGVVRFAGAIRGLDRGVILDHGGYYTVLGKLGELVVPAGARVKRGDRIGRAARQRVYLEVRVKLGPGGLPIDPEPHLVTENAARKR